MLRTGSSAHYHFTEALYESNNSLVYRGHRTSDNQPVILKVLNPTYPSQEKIAQFKREYELTRSLNPSTLPTLPSVGANEVPQGEAKRSGP